MRKNIYLLLLAFCTLQLAAQPSGKPTSEHLVGTFFENLNYAADGGRYLKLIINRNV